MSTTKSNQPTDEERTSTHVLEFSLGENHYCVDIGYVAEIVNAEQLTAVPNTPDHVEGVMDLRGETTKIVTLREIFGDGDDDSVVGNRIIVFKRKRGSDERIGWLADEVYQVQEVWTDAVDTSIDGEGIAGVIRREDEFVFWIDPTSVRI